MPEKTHAAILSRFDSLIDEGEAILNKSENVPPVMEYNEYQNTHYQQRAGYKKLSWPDFVEWRTKAATLLCYVLSKDHVHQEKAKSLPEISPQEDTLVWAINFLRAIKDDLVNGFLDSLASKIEAEIAADYMGQAEELIAKGQSGEFDHVPAAVLAGAVLEKALRKLCAETDPPISVIKPNGDPKTLNPLIDDLKKAGVFNELKAKQLQTWAHIRNKAAHGEFDQFKRSDVEQMIQGITRFLGDYLT
jgi:hypothetical protein